MSKLPDNLEDIFDVSLSKIATNVSKYFHKTNHTPNIITTYSLIFGVSSLYFLHVSNLGLFISCWWIAYFFDTLDGLFARKYKMVSKFGDYYDHIKDIIVFIMLMIYLYGNYKITNETIIIFIISISLVNFHLGCQECYVNNNESHTLSYLKILCPDVSYIQYSCYFGAGTFNILLPLYICFFMEKI